MVPFTDVLEWITNAVFLVGTVVAIGLWRRHPESQAGRWLAATFLTLSGVIVIGIAVGSPAETPPDVITKLLLAILLLFPYLLFRFADSFRPASRRTRTLASGATAVVIGATFLLPPFPEPGAAPGTWGMVFVIYVLALVGLFVGLLAVTAVSLWKAGSGQPTIARGRMRVLAVASLLVALALVVELAGSADAGGEGSLADIIGGLIATLAGIAFLAGFAPPGPVRAWLRQPEERQLYTATLRLMAAGSQQEVMSTVLPPFQRLIGARGVVLMDQGRLIGQSGEVEPLLTLDLPSSEIHQVDLDERLSVLASVSPAMPIFGSDERALTERLAVIARLALARVAHLQSERRARNELEVANQELEAFVYSASHDLKNPLIAMLGYLELLQRDKIDELDDEARWFVQRLAANGHYMQDLISDLLELSRVGRTKGEPVRIGLNGLVREVHEDLHSRYPELTVTVGPDIPTLWLDPTRTRQLVANLLENAGAHAGDHPHVDITASRTPDGGVELIIEDDGPGIPAEHRERVFGVFERLALNEKDGGTGIGLAICRKVVESSGGSIRADQQDRGARFVISLPPSAVATETPAATAHDTVPALSPSLPPHEVPV